MKKVIFLLLFLFPLCTFSQLYENFNDGLFKNDLVIVSREVQWMGDETCFKVNTELQLQSDANGATSPIYLRTNSNLTSNAYWEWWMKMDFNPTSSNYARVYLCSDEDDLTGDQNGLFVRLGYTKKNIALIYSQKGKTNKIIIEGKEKRLDLSSVEIRIKATLDRSGNFNLYSRLDNETDYVLEGSCLFTDVLDGGNFGVVCNFTTTRSQLFYFDDFLVRELNDDEQEIVESDPDPGFDTPVYGDIIFSEIMAKPGSESVEYVELYNASNKTVQLSDLLYYYADKPYQLPTGRIMPGDYFVLCKPSSIDFFSEDIKVFGVTSFPVIADAGKLLQFGTATGSLISWFEYDDTMYEDSDKKSNGGYSLECMDISNKSNRTQNWIASTTAGGTPGKTNSSRTNNPDIEIPVVKGIEILANSLFRITFSKPMDRNSLLNMNSYSLSVPSYSILSLEADYPKGTYVDLKLNNHPDSGTMVRITLSEIRDLSGYALEEEFIVLGEGHQAAARELVINEILFNPPSDGNEYVEIYNRSDKAFDLRFLSLTSRKPSDGSFNKAWPLSSLHQTIEPGEYIVITQSRGLVCEFFECRGESLFIEPGGMPSLANTSGCAVLLNNRTGEVVDEFAYDEKMHAPGISNKKGVALERIDTDRPSDDPDNWHSASEESGYGTPGYINSQHTNTDSDTGMPTNLQGTINVVYPSSESDSYIIYYRLDMPGYRCNAYIFDSLGRKIKQIANNQLLGTEGQLVWDGRGTSGSGICIVYLEVYNSEGKLMKFRKPVVVK
jgi:hypothetical protein